MDIISLTQKLISIPSYVDQSVNEVKIGNFLLDYLGQNCPWLKLEKQLVEGGRFNIIAKGTNYPKLIFIGHMDTVKPSLENQIKPSVKDEKLYGLGSVDMKAGIAAVIDALKDFGKTKNISLIFDCDEEYYFKGIKKILQKYSFKPDLIICPEPTNLEIVSGCRGLSELSFEVLGKTAHAATPEKGINAIEKSIEIVESLRKKLSKTDSVGFGKTTANLSSVNGGRLKQGEIVVQPNAVPDITKVLLDIRGANPNLGAKEIFLIIDEIAASCEARIRNRKINLDYKPYMSKKAALGKLELAIKKAGERVSYQSNLNKVGFYEVALAANAWKCSAANFGPSEKDTAHSNRERVNLESLIKSKRVFKNLIRQYEK